MGFPSPARDYLEERIDLNKLLIKNPLSTFYFWCQGNSMVNAYIPDKTLLVVDRSIEAQNGDIVVAAVNGEFIVRYLKKKERKCWLVPANNKYKDIEITAEMKAEIWGVVTSIISNPKEIKNVRFS
ncbi:translesion error-prone DNA polymerase V autoproteolytic subunit [Panacibacter ginsenosidivorans]|uniref:Translesion error-prone DNA polymerase V autoproteolytic subunit n=1 Tax=Panacibacter ginsenosidivorans TaxID=1813871 RepID=A0A5B8VDF9_9BACT|nr:translesion error-prone DNA polymerase V autoproteolytic subunit [Panacibacter ginsenosidivorans]QEC69352.1 translesion error-prone DNA polymerase V autoproteolytic subunit [Panacibacter ginsenosidivorans]